ncbi:hypothetical protein IGS60_26095 [Janthinobacterium sp. FW305-128]|nr:hypothetical protein [Janthinobacterium sp. FW305-128]
MPAPEETWPPKAKPGYPNESFPARDFPAEFASNQECTMQVQKTNNAPLSCILCGFLKNASLWCIERAAWHSRLRGADGAL